MSYVPLFIYRVWLKRCMPFATTSLAGKKWEDLDLACKVAALRTTDTMPATQCDCTHNYDKSNAVLHTLCVWLAFARVNFIVVSLSNVQDEFFSCMQLLCPILHGVFTRQSCFIISFKSSLASTHAGLRWQFLQLWHMINYLANSGIQCEMSTNTGQQMPDNIWG